MRLFIQSLTPEVRALYEGHGMHHKGDSGLDLFCAEDLVIPAGQQGTVKLGIKAAARGEDGSPVGWLLMPRSSISKTPLRLCNSIGLIDAPYRGEVMAKVDNIRDTDYKLEKGAKIVQAVSFTGGPVHFELVDELDSTSRGEGGFGSTNTVAEKAVAAPCTTASPCGDTPSTQGPLLRLQPLSDEVAELYKEHGQFHSGDSGLDLFCVRDEIVPAHTTWFVKLGMKAAAWEGNQNVSWFLMPRSSISKTPLRLCNSVGLIDAGYRGEVMAAVHNRSDKDYQISRKDRIVQAVALGGAPMHCQLVDSLDSTDRGDGGFGSTAETAIPKAPAAPAVEATTDKAWLWLQTISEEAAVLYKEHGQYHKGDSGLDLFCISDEVVPAGKTVFLKLGIKAAVWKGSQNLSWLLMPRSSISKTPLRLCNSVGLIDAGYRGEVMVAVDNVSGTDHQVKKGDRIVQAVLFDGQALAIRHVESLDRTSRGEGGFGSTSVPTPMGQQALAAKRPVQAAEEQCEKVPRTA